MVLRLLAVILAVWEPLNTAAFVAPVFSTIAQRGSATAAFVAARVVVAGISVAAGIALWQGQPDAPKLAGAALVLSTAAAVVTYTTRLLPTNVMPGDALFWLALIVCFNAVWLGYLWRYSRRA
jgi:hypothetical protein